MSLSRFSKHFSLALLLASAAFACDTFAQAPGQSAPQSLVHYNVSQSVEKLQMIVKSSKILSIDIPIESFQVQNESIVTAAPINPKQFQVSSLQPGFTQLNLWDESKNLYTVDVIVSADTREVEAILNTQFPGSNLKVTPLSQGTSAVLSGSVTAVDDVDRAVQIAKQFYAEVITNVSVVGVQQILLHTKIMEVSRTKFRELGVDWALADQLNGTGFVLGTAGLLDVPATQFPTLAPIGAQANAQFSAQLGRTNLDGFLVALRRNNLVKVLAEPTVVATHGRPARFLVGGKVPYIVPTGNGAVSIQYEEFGTAIDFLPFMVGPGRVRLEVRPEVSEPDNARSVTVQGTSVPAFTNRYVETAVELNAGQTFAIAGLLQNRTEAVTRGTPFLGELPWIGTFFRRVSEQNNEIELLITVTPELAEAMDPHQVPCGGPGLNTDSPSDKQLFFNGYIEVPRADNLCPSCGPGESCEDYNQGMQYPAVQGTPVSEYSPPITPGAQPTQIAPGVSIVAPQ